MTTEYSWNQPCCERCWIDEHAVWAGDDDEDDLWEHMWQRLISIRLPHVVLESPVERCAFCGHPTFIGVYVRHDPNDVPFPAKREVEDVDTGGKV